MRIGVALFQFFPGRVGGAGDYIERLISGLLRVMSFDDELILLGNPENLRPFENICDPRLKRNSVNWSRHWIQILRLTDLVFPFSLSRCFVGQFNRLALDVVLYPQQSIFPRGLTAPAVVSVMDLLHYRWPQFVSRTQRWLRRRKEVHLIHNCHHTISISQSTRSDLLEYYPIPPQKCSVVYLAGKSPGEAIGKNPVPDGCPYVYYPANAFPHKNHERLIQAFRLFRDANPQTPARLILSGQISSALRKLLRTQLKQSDLMHLGFLKREQVAAVYGGCRAVVIPSLFEGFGMPLVEGLGFHRPVYCSNLHVFRELAGDMVEYFDPGSVSDIQKAFASIFLGSPRSPDPQSVTAILERLNWDRCASETYVILKQASRRTSN